MRRRIVFLLVFYGLTVLTFIGDKAVFMAVCGGAHGASLASLPVVVAHGLTLDLSTALYFLLVPFLLSLAGVWARVPRWLYRAYCALVAVAFALAFVADTSLYPFWHFKLDASCLQYLATPGEAMASVSGGYVAVRCAAVAAVAALLFLAFRGLAVPRPLPTLRRRLAATALHIAAVPLIVVGLRGGLGESTTNVGQVYFSQQQFLNHAAVNPVFSFLASFEKSANYVPDYHFMADRTSEAIVDSLYPTVSLSPDTLLRTPRPNVVVILLESCGGIFTADIGGRRGVMPRLDSLVARGVYFEQFYANSWRTDRGTLCTWSGYPSFPRSSVMKMPAKTGHLPGLAATLRREGYRTTYLYGGDINFTNMRSYLVNTGFEQLLWQQDFSREEQLTAQWGVRDDITFRRLAALVGSLPSPFLIGYSTLSSHEPWDVPTHRLKDPVLNAFNYVDECLGDFIDRVSQTPAWDDLLVVLLPDHGYTYGDVDELHPQHDHVPMLWLGGAVKAPRRVTQVCNQTDLPATLLGQMGLSHADFRFSRDVMSRNYRHPFAVHTYNNAISVKDSARFAVYDLTAGRTVVSQGTGTDSLLRVGKAVLQAAARDLKNMK